MGVGLFRLLWFRNLVNALLDDPIGISDGYHIALLRLLRQTITDPVDVLGKYQGRITVGCNSDELLIRQPFVADLLNSF